jgi:hypothetical protein
MDELRTTAKQLSTTAKQLRTTETRKTTETARKPQYHRSSLLMLWGGVATFTS